MCVERSCSHAKTHLATFYKLQCHFFARMLVSGKNHNSMCSLADIFNLLGVGNEEGLKIQIRERSMDVLPTNGPFRSLDCLQEDFQAYC